MPQAVISPITSHWIVPFAASLSAPCLHALPQLDALGALPNLRALLSTLSVSARTEGDEFDLSMPHEQVLAAQMGWPTTDGLLPWATYWADQDGVVLSKEMSVDRTWGLLSPGHWLMGRDHLTLLDPQALNLSEAQSRSLFDAVKPLFETDGWDLIWGGCNRWYASHASLQDLPTASLDRVIGRNPDVWLTGHPQARLVRRLQSEVQMLLYQHPINDEREAAGLSSVNSFWLSGCGPTPHNMTLPTTTQLVTDLRAPLLADDMAAWLQAWHHLDSTVFKQACDALDAGQDIHITLCGECHAVTLSRPSNSSLSGKLWQSVKRLAGASKVPEPSVFLASLS